MIPTPQSIANYFNLTILDASTVRSDPPYCPGHVGMPDRINGGLLVSQAVSSFLTLYPGLTPHTVNYKFITIASSKHPLQFTIRHFKEARLASVIVLQNGKQVGTGHIRYSSHSDLLDASTILFPDYISTPESYPLSVEELGRPRDGKDMKIEFPLEIRPVESPVRPLRVKNRSSHWLRFHPSLHGDLKPKDGLAVALFISDFAVLRIAGLILKASSKASTSGSSSLHHTVRIHEASINPLDWFLVVVDCEIISSDRALVEASVFNEARNCVLSVTQEGCLIRVTPKL